MISYPIATDDLNNRIRLRHPSWHQRAEKELEQCITDGHFSERCKPIWNKLKNIFETIQSGHNGRPKCVYCESYLSKEKRSAHGHIDHFRPKSLYYHLSYNPRNYVLACTICNASYKRNHFPIEGTQNLNTMSEDELESEKPLLIHPLDPNEPNLQV